jgi:hypothetical protein
MDAGIRQWACHCQPHHVYALGSGGRWLAAHSGHVRHGPQQRRGGVKRHGVAATNGRYRAGAHGRQHANAHANAHPDADPNANPDDHPDAHAYPDADRDLDAHRYPDAHTNLDAAAPDRNSDAPDAGCSNTHANPHANTHANRDGDSHAHSHPHPHAYRNLDANAHADRDPDNDSHRDPHPNEHRETDTAHRMACLDRHPNPDASPDLDAHSQPDTTADLDASTYVGPAATSAVVPADPVLHVDGLVYHNMLLR